ncbi:uncharacterized protein Dvir_GJ26871 [Drosophila virilis]|uniref:Uncharacterized protein n=1 Tax=Drosophila virilis TaxID=7244 RepID=A0A0Q9WSJ6_DROVI|nr:uncharacterized protein Dvir_GJ26871 [Drosophila virilis]
MVNSNKRQRQWQHQQQWQSKWQMRTEEIMRQHAVSQLHMARYNTLGISENTHKCDFSRIEMTNGQFH